MVGSARNVVASRSCAVSGGVCALCFRHACGMRAAVELNKEIARARSVTALLLIVEAELHRFDGRHVATCLHRLAAHARRTNLTQPLAANKAWRALAAHHEEVLVSGGLVVGAQALSNIAWAIATLRDLYPALHRSRRALHDAASRLSAEFSAQGVANTAWALALLASSAQRRRGGGGPAEAHAWEDLGTAARARVRESVPQNIANVSWAFALARFEDDGTSSALAAETLPRIDAFPAQELANVTWAFAKLPGRHSATLAARVLAVAAARRRSLADFEGQHISGLMWAFAQSQHAPDSQAQCAAFRCRVAEEALRRLADFTAQGIANIAYSMASLMQGGNPVQVTIRQRQLRSVVGGKVGSQGTLLRCAALVSR